MTRVIAFDVATKTGCAFGVSGGIPKAWTVNLAKGGANHLRLARAIQMTAACIERFKPELVVVEPAIGGAKKGTLLIELAACVKGEAARRGCRIVEYYPTTARKHFVGRSKTTRDFPGKTRAAAKAAIKAEVLHKCRILGWDVEGLDAADACCLWDYACALESRSHQVTSIGGLFTAEAQ